MKTIKKIEFINHPVLGNLSFNLVDENEEKSEKYITLIIGPNGTGKTKILDAVIKILLELRAFLQNNKYKVKFDYGFTITLSNNSKLTFNKKTHSFEIDENITIDNLPDNILLSTHTFNEKFPMGLKDNYYQYGGIRTASNNIFLNRPPRDTFNFFKRIIINKEKKDFVKEIFNELNLSAKISVKYENKKRKLFNDKLIKHLLNNELNNFQKTIEQEIIRPRSIRFQETSYKRFLKEERAEKIFDFLRNNKSFLEKLSKNKYIEIPFNIDNDNIQDFLNKVEIIEYLNEIEITKFSSFNIFREEYFDFSEASSGEINFMHLYFFILANIRENSLILIDEPEISFHPNWQNRLLSILEPLFNKYSNTHTIIATHSHFLVSYLKSENSALIKLFFDENNKINCENVLPNTYGWSAEQILFDVFNMFTDRNYYISKIVENILQEMSKSTPNNKFIKKEKEKLKEIIPSLKLSKEDPFSQIIDKIVNDEI